MRRNIRLRYSLFLSVGALVSLTLSRRAPLFFLNYPSETILRGRQTAHTASLYPFRTDALCQSAAEALHSGLYVHAGRDAAVKISDWQGRSTAFKLGRNSNNKGSFTAKMEKEVPFLLRYNNTRAPLVKLLLKPCLDSRGTPFYAVEGNIVQWASVLRKGLFEQMAWCQRLSIALQVDESQEWLEQENLEYQSYNWDDRTGGNPNLQTGISIDGTFKMIDAGLTLQNDTDHWESAKLGTMFRQKATVLKKMGRTHWAHGTPRMRRSNAKTLFQDLLHGSKEERCSTNSASNAVESPSLWHRQRRANTTLGHCTPIWDAFAHWVEEQKRLPYDSPPGFGPSLAAALKAATGFTQDDDDCYVQCLAETAQQQRQLLSKAYMDDLKLGRPVAPLKDLY